jgi:hypothetical protein
MHQFAYHMALLYDTIGELRRASEVGVIEQVSITALLLTLADYIKLFAVLDIPKFKKLGTAVNDTVG